ncbi:MAG TPA: hypothetical protein VJK52_05165 [Candidatus Nanoarchaeia archaeon]|nr:hypothetical protein [Candidatus Nanoarchaeia archaeon]
MYSYLVVGFTLLSIPIEELLWWLTAGMFISPLYEYWQGSRVATMQVKKKTI